MLKCFNININIIINIIVVIIVVTVWDFFFIMIDFRCISSVEFVYLYIFVPVWLLL